MLTVYEESELDCCVAPPTASPVATAQLQAPVGATKEELVARMSIVLTPGGYEKGMIET